MSIIEEAARRMEALRRAGVGGDPSAAGLAGRSRGGPGHAGGEDRTGGGARSDHADRSVAPAPAMYGRNGAPAEGRSPGPGAPPASAPAPAAPTQRHDQDGKQRVEVDFAHAAAMGFLTPDLARNRLADEFRTAKHGLLQNIRGQSAARIRRANCIMVTSALPGEGKTFSSVNLALSLSREVDLRTLLVDADVLNPRVLPRLGLTADHGLLDLITNPDLQLDDLVLRTNIDKLSLLPAGTASEHSTELLASEAMDRLIGNLASYDPNRVVVFDAPPLLVAPETRQLAAHVGQIVLVVEAQRTPRSAVIAAIEAIKDRPVVMTLLNKARAGSGKRYGYEYGYGYGYGKSKSDRENSAAA